MSTPIQGSKLSPALKARVLSMYVNRWTYENAASLKHWTQHPTGALISDAEWLRTHAFYLTLTGELDRRRRYAEPYYPGTPDPVQSPVEGVQTDPSVAAGRASSGVQS